MHLGEILNLSWKDIDFGRLIVGVNPKKRTEHTWPWEIKDKERWRLPLSEDLVNRLAENQETLQRVIPTCLFPPSGINCL